VQLSKVNDKLAPSMSFSVVYSIPCSCGNIYIGETEHQDACKKGDEKSPAIAEHAGNQNPRHSRTMEWRVKEAPHIHLAPEEQRFNQDFGLVLPCCWPISTRLLA